MAWHVGHSWETLLTIHSLPLPGGPFPQVFPAAVVHLGESSAFITLGGGGGGRTWEPVLTIESLHMEGEIKQTTLEDSVF